MALAPSFFLLAVPSRARMTRSMPTWSSGVEAGDGTGDGFVHVGHGFADAFAEVAVGHAVAQFPRFVFAGAGAAGDDGTADGAALQGDLDFDGGVAARIDHFAAADGLDER